MPDPAPPRKARIWRAVWVNCGWIVVQVGIRVVRADAQGGFCSARTAGGGNSAAMGRAPCQRRSYRHLRTTAWVLGPGCCQRLRRIGRRRFGTFGEPACNAAKGESRWRPSFTGGVGAPWIPDGNGLRQQPQPNRVPFRRTAGDGVKSVSVYGKRRLCGNRSPESALAILQKSPPAAVWTHDQPHAITSNCGPADSTNFLERHSLKAQEDSGGYL